MIDLLQFDERPLRSERWQPPLNQRSQWAIRIQSGLSLKRPCGSLGALPLLREIIVPRVTGCEKAKNAMRRLAQSMRKTAHVFSLVSRTIGEWTVNPRIGATIGRDRGSRGGRPCLATPSPSILPAPFRP